MKKLIFVIMFLFFHQIALAEQSNTLQLKINFKYQHNNQTNNLKNTIRLDVKNKNWEVIDGVKRPSNNIILLAQIERSDAKTAKVRFLLLENNQIISQPQMVVAYDQQGKMVLEGKNGKINLDVIASR